MRAASEGGSGASTSSCAKPSTGQSIIKQRINPKATCFTIFDHYSIGRFSIWKSCDLHHFNYYDTLSERLDVKALRSADRSEALCYGLGTSAAIEGELSFLLPVYRDYC